MQYILHYECFIFAPLSPCPPAPVVFWGNMKYYTPILIPLTSISVIDTVSVSVIDIVIFCDRYCFWQLAFLGFVY